MTEVSAELTSSSGVASPVEEQSKAQSRKQEQKKTRPHFKDFITSHHVGLILLFSVLLVLSGILFILNSLGLIAPGSHDILTRFMSPMEVQIMFAVMGTLLIVSPLFLDNFVFNALRYERDLRMRAEESTREAQLLQDILTHDIRNYNQVARLSAELIMEETKGIKDTDQLVLNLLNSIDGSTQLVERAKMLGRVISDRDLDRHPFDLLESIKRSVDLVSRSNPERKITAVAKINSSPVAPLLGLDTSGHEIEVLADDLLDEAFSNLFSNSVKYTEGPEVFIAIEFNKEYDRLLRTKCWKVTISDAGRGIPDDFKERIFSRYLDGAKGSGLGLSIVHALVVARYHGRIQVKDRIANDHTKGTVVELWLPAALVRETKEQ